MRSSEFFYLFPIRDEVIDDSPAGRRWLEVTGWSMGVAFSSTPPFDVICKTKQFYPILARSHFRQLHAACSRQSRLPLLRIGSQSRMQRLCNDFSIVN